MKPLRLCFIGRADSVHTRRWVDPFVERGDQVWVVNIALRPARRPWAGVHLVDPTRALNLPWLRYPVWTLYTRAFLRRIRPDLVHAHCLDLSGWVAAATGYHPLVVTAWGSDILLHTERSAVARRLARWVLRQADAVTTPAQPLYDRAVSLAGTSGKVHLIHWGIDCQVFQPEGERAGLRAALDLPAEAPILLCPRALAPVYNIETVLQALKHVVQVEPKALLLLIEFNVQPAYRQQIDEWIQGWGLHDHVRFLPPVESPAQMAALYRLARVVVSLPLSDSLSLTVLESMACGTPVVVADLAAYKDWIVDGETGYRLPPRDAAAVAEVLLTLLRDDAGRRAIGQRCREMACQRAGLERQKERAVALYEALLGGRRSKDVVP